MTSTTAGLSLGMLIMFGALNSTLTMPALLTSPPDFYTSGASLQNQQSPPCPVQYQQSPPCPVQYEQSPPCPVQYQTSYAPQYAQGVYSHTPFVTGLLSGITTGLNTLLGDVI